MDAAFKEELRFAALSVWRGFRQGTFQGTKIRLPHAFVLTLINNRPAVWNSATLREFMDRVAAPAWEHSRNLGLFVGFYKLALALGRLIRLALGDKVKAPPGRPTNQFDSFLAGALVSHFVWARMGGAVNSQIVMYLTVRVLMALFKVASNKGFPVVKDWSYNEFYPYWASLTWGLVMWLFEYYPNELQGSLAGTMTNLYHESNSWKQGAGEFFPSPATAAVFVYLTLRAREKLLASGQA